MQALPPNDPVTALPAAPAPPTHVGRQEHRRGNQHATNPSTLEPARRARTKAPVSPRLAHWQRAWGVDGGRFALWAGCAVGSGGCLGPGGTLYGCPVGMRELLGPRRQVQPARARGETGCGVSRRVARECWEGPISPPYPQTCPISALPLFPQPHRPPWARVLEARRRANLHAAKFHPARGASVHHDHLQQAGRSGRDLCKQQRPVSRSWLAGCDDGAPSPDAQKDAHEPRLSPSPARAAVWARPIGALWVGRRRRVQRWRQPARLPGLVWVQGKKVNSHPPYYPLSKC